MPVKYFFSHAFISIGRISARKLFKMSAENDSEGIKAILARIETIKKKLLNLTGEVGQVQSALLKVQSKSRTLPITEINRPFSTTSAAKRKLIKLEESFDINDSLTLENNPKKSKSNFVVDEFGFVQVYTDGACENNGRANARAGLGVWFGENHSLNISEPVSGRATNNCGEIQACTAAINAAREANVDKLVINTDSQFVINSMTKWIQGWKKKGWKTVDGNPVKNKEDFQLLDEAIAKMESVKFNYVPGHKGITGNCAADELARQGAARYKLK